jgi:hypothetical protein
MAVKHAFTSPVADNGVATEVGPNEWNANHTIENDTVTYAMIQNVVADRLLGRTSGTGDIEEIPCTAFARSILDDVDATAVKATLALAAIATSGSGADLQAASVTLAKISSITSQRILARKTAGAGVIEEITTSEVLDFISNTNGAMLGRFGGSWGVLSRVFNDDGDLVLGASATPIAPAADRVKVTSQNWGGRQTLGLTTPDGITSVLQNHVGRAGIICARPTVNTNNHSIIGAGTLTFIGTATARNVANTSFFAGSRRHGIVSSTSAGNLAGARIPILHFWRGNVAGAGGFTMVLRWGISDAVLVTDARMFMGLWNITSAPTNVDPSSLTNLVGVGCDANDTQLQLYAAGGAAQARVSLGANFPVNTVNTDLYETVIYAPPNGSYIAVQVTRLNTGHVTTQVITNAANLPASTTFLTINFWRSNNATAAACAVDWASIWAESET